MPKVLLRRMKTQEMENKERNVIDKYLDVDSDFMHGSFWLKIILSKLTTENINHLQYPLLCKKKGISRSLFKIITAACFFIITKYKKIRNIYQEINQYIALSLVISSVSGNRHISIFPHCSQIVVSFF